MGWLWQAIVLFTVTNIDDLIVLALFFARARVVGIGTRAVVLGQYAGFLAVLVCCLAGAAGAGTLPERAIRLLGVIPILLGLWMAWREWRGGEDEAPPAVSSWWAVAGVTVANSADNVGVYVPAFAGRSVGALAGFAVVFLVLVGLWCVAGRALTAHPAVTAAVHRWGNVLTPLAFIAIGCAILIGAFS